MLMAQRTREIADGVAATKDPKNPDLHRANHRLNTLVGFKERFEQLSGDLPASVTKAELKKLASLASKTEAHADKVSQWSRFQTIAMNQQFRILSTEVRTQTNAMAMQLKTSELLSAHGRETERHVLGLGMVNESTRSYHTEMESGLTAEYANALSPGW